MRRLGVGMLGLAAARRAVKEDDGGSLASFRSKGLIAERCESRILGHNLAKPVVLYELTLSLAAFDGFSKFDEIDSDGVTLRRARGPVLPRPSQSQGRR